jgi:hypothetical protein
MSMATPDFLLPLPAIALPQPMSEAEIESIRLGGADDGAFVY